MIRVLICPDTFKESLEAHEAAKAVKEGLDSVCERFSCDLAPLADGGEGSLKAAVGESGDFRYFQVCDPVGRAVSAPIALLDSGVVLIEMASCAGLALLRPDERNPLRASTFGVGQLIRAALDFNPRRIIVFVGGSATNDGGAGMAEALGTRIIRAHAKSRKLRGFILSGVNEIDVSGLDGRIASVEFVVAADVRNPLLGSNGATHTFGQQKGATAEDLVVLEKCMTGWADVIRRDMGIDVRDIPGAGAGGGLAAGLMAFCGARVESGFKIVSDFVNLCSRMQNCDIVITGEGRFDATTSAGKVVSGVMEMAGELNKPCVALCGSIESGSEPQGDNQKVFSILRPGMTLEESFRKAPELLRKFAGDIGKWVLSGELFGGLQ